MNRSRIRFMVAVMAISMIGLLALQGYWVHDAVQLKERQFEREIRHVLFGVVSRLETEESFRIMNEGWENALKTDPELRALAGSDSLRKDASWTRMAFHHQHPHGRRPKMFIRVEQQESLANIAVGAILFQGLSHENGPQTPPLEAFPAMPQKEADSLQRLAWENEKLIEQIMIKVKKSRRKLAERTTTQELDSLIQMEMEHNHIEDAYWFEVRESDDSLIFRSQVPASPTGKVFLTRLFPNDFSTEGGYLKLGFVDRPTGFWRAIGIILPTSGVLALLAMMAFGFILYALNRQKKLSDMKTDFINNMTHELKTPIATISLASEALMDPQMNAGPQQVSDFAKIIFEENKRLRDQVERVLQMAAIEKGEIALKRGTVHIHEIIKTESARIARWVEERGGSIELELNATNDKILGDSIHISGIIANLLDNANKYSPKNPKIVIRTRNSTNQIAIEVIDNGVGMDRDALHKVFDKFYRVPTGNVHDVKGFGLGLSYVKSMAEVHGGKISVTSELGKGSVFFLTLPTKS